MTTDLRADAAKARDAAEIASREYRINPAADPTETFRRIYAAGFTAGAREFAEHMIAKFPRLEARSKPYRDELAQFLASAPGTDAARPLQPTRGRGED